MKKISYQNRELPTLELSQITNNRLGILEFNKIGADSVTAQRNFLDVQLQVDNINAGGRLNIVCDGRQFNYQTYEDAVLAEFLQYANARMMGEGRKPVYVTDVDVPLRLFNVTQRDAIQTLHFLRYVRNFENRSSTGGTSRNDNFTVGAGPIPEPSAYTLVALGLTAFCFLRRRK